MMENNDSIRIFNQGVKVWNDWRDDNPDIDPNLKHLNLKETNIDPGDLSEMNFRKVNLSGANFHQADLSNANFEGADLTLSSLSGANLFAAKLVGADLRWAHLSRTKLIRANLEKAILNWADMSKADLEGANLKNADLEGANLREANLREAILESAKLFKATLVEANLSLAKLTWSDLCQADLHKAILSRASFLGAKLHNANISEARLPVVDHCPEGYILQKNLSFRWADLRYADLSKSNLSNADFFGAYLSDANFSKADLSGANLERASLVGTNFTKTELSNCRIFGISAWECNLTESIQNDLIISPNSQPIITVDNLEVAQFIYLLLSNEKLRDVIDTISKKVVLILGRFTPKRKIILDTIKKELRSRDYLPILFDFEKPSSRDLTETVTTLAHLSRFIIADITEAKSIPQELQSIVPHLPSLIVQPILQSSEHEYGMFEHLKRYPWVLPIYQYKDMEDLLNSLRGKIIIAAEVKANELQKT